MGPKKVVKPVSRWQPLSENASVMQTTVVPGLDDLSVRPEDLSLEDLQHCFKFIEQSNRTIEVENAVIERYLQRMDPSLIARMESILEAAASALQKAERAAQLQAASSYLSIPSHASRRNTEETLFSTPRSTASTAKSFTMSAASSKFNVLALADKGPRVQPNHKIEIINREIEELRNSLEKFKKKAKDHNYFMRCRNEELTTRLQEVMEHRNYFEKKIVEEGVDKMTKRVPAEKFIRYLDTKLQSEDSLIDKLRMKTNSIKTHLNRLHQQLIQKEELGEVLHAVDFEQLKIENQECEERLDEKILHLVNVKRINGKCGTILNFSKKKLQEQMNRLTQLHRNVQIKEGMVRELLRDEEIITREVEVALKNVNRITDLMKSYTVPGVIEYIQKKAELHSLKRNIKIRERQLKLRELALQSQVQRLRAISEHTLLNKKSSRISSSQSSEIISKM